MNTKPVSAADAWKAATTITTPKQTIPPVIPAPSSESDVLGNRLGGRGKCEYCGEMVNNVSYHAACQCKKRPLLPMEHGEMVGFTVDDNDPSPTQAIQIVRPSLWKRISGFFAAKEKAKPDKIDKIEATQQDAKALAQDMNAIGGDFKTVEKDVKIAMETVQAIASVEVRKEEAKPAPAVELIKAAASQVQTATVTPQPEVKLNEPPPLPPPLPELARFDHVTKMFGKKIALQDISFVVEDLPNVGELISLVGPSGCGKSTVLRNLAGLTPHFPPTTGTITIFGKPAERANASRGLIDQKYSLFPNLTVIKNVAFGLKLKGVHRKERHEKAMVWIKKVGLEGSEQKYPYELSGGMQQRVAIASTLILEPKMLLMDEPFGALDPKIRLEMQALLVDLWKELQSTVFIVTHSMEEAVYLGDRVYRMLANPGRLAEEIKVPRPDFPPEKMREFPEFKNLVKDLTKKLECSDGNS